jgi:hypothetical protein
MSWVYAGAVDLRRCSFTPIQVIDLNATVIEKHVLTFRESNRRYHVRILSNLYSFGIAGHLLPSYGLLKLKGWMYIIFISVYSIILNWEYGYALFMIKLPKSDGANEMLGTCQFVFLLPPLFRNLFSTLFPKICVGFT